MRIPRLLGAALVFTATLTTVGVSHRIALAFSTTDVVGPVGSGTFGAKFHILPNGNFIVVDQDFDSATKVDIGAIYLYNGTTHQQISVVTGATAGDRIGGGGFADVGNSNVVVLLSLIHI